MSEERRLIHYSTEYITEVRSVDQAPLDGASRVDKPRGLWVSAEGDNDWPSWCRSQDFRVDGLSHPTQILLKPDAKVLRINGSAELIRFHEAYSTVAPWAKKMQTPDFSRRYAVRWLDLAQEYQGIIIAPYVWEQRLEMPWYYGWDCASGCIWDAQAVAELMPLPVVPVGTCPTDSRELDIDA